MNLNLMAPISNQIGYGIVGTNLLKTLDSFGCDISLFPVGSHPQFEPQDETIIQQCLLNAINYDSEAAVLKIWHENDLAISVHSRGPYITFPFFETDFNQQKQRHIAISDVVLVTCEWAKNIVSKYRDESTVKIVPLGIDPQIFHPNLPVKRNPKIFQVFTIGKWEVRKNHKQIISCFSKAFTAKQCVQLNLLTNNPFLTPPEANYWQGLCYDSDLASKIYIIPRLNTTKEVAAFIAGQDLGLFLSSSENWDLSVSQAQSCFKHVIVSDCTAHQAYCNETNSMLVKMGPDIPANDGKWFNGEFTWKSFDKESEEQTIEYLRNSYKIWKEHPEGYVNCNDVGQKLTWENTAKRIVEILQ